MADSWSKVSVRVASPSVGAMAIAQLFDVEADQKVESGTRLSPRSPAVAASSFCVWRCPLERGHDLEEHIQWVLEFLKSMKSSRTSDDMEVDVRLSYSSGSGQGSFALDPTQLASLARCGATLCVDLYPPGDDD